MKENGFTLIELLVVLAIGSLFLAGLSATLASFGENLRNVERSDQKIATEQDFATLRNILENADYADRAGNILPGSDSELNFRIRPPHSQYGANWLEMSLAVEQNKNSVKLLLRSTDENDKEAVQVLADDSKNISLRKTVARPSLDEDLRVASVTITIADHQNRLSSLTVTPRVNAKTGCVFDPISQGCRP